MRFYKQTDLFEVLISAAGSPGLCPDAGLLASYKQNRLARAERALRSRNIFLYTEGTRTSTALNAVTTIYTQPAGERMLLLGYSDNLRYGSTIQPLGVNAAAADRDFPQVHSVRIVGREGRALTEDFIPAQAGISGQPRFTSVLLTVPIILEANEQIAVDLGYDSASATPATIPPQAFVFFCLKVKERLTPEDYETMADIQRYIAANDFQKGLYFNCATQSPPSGSAGWFANDEIVFDTQVAGGVAVAETRPVTNPTLIVGIGTNLGASRVTITDTADGYSFSLNQLMQVSAINLPNYENVAPAAASTIAPAGAPLWTQYLQLPMPHLLRSGAKLRVEAINGSSNGTITAIDPTAWAFAFGTHGVNRVLYFQAVSV
jgi:hypothetical protein